MSCTQCSCLKWVTQNRQKKDFNWEVSSIFEICIWKCNWRHWSYLSHLLIILTCSTQGCSFSLKMTKFPHCQESQGYPVTFRTATPHQIYPVLISIPHHGHTSSPCYHGHLFSPVFMDQTNQRCHRLCACLTTESAIPLLEENVPGFPSPSFS